VKILETQQQAVLLPTSTFQKLAKTSYFISRSIIIFFSCFTTISTLSLHCTSAIHQEPPTSPDSIFSQSTKPHCITYVKEHVQIRHFYLIESSPTQINTTCGNQIQINDNTPTGCNHQLQHRSYAEGTQTTTLDYNTLQLQGSQIKTAARNYTKPEYKPPDYTTGKSSHLQNSKKFLKRNLLENSNSQYSLLICKVYACDPLPLTSRALLQNSQELELHQNSQVNYTNFREMSILTFR
jgi:hypothetical protein